MQLHSNHSVGHQVPPDLFAADRVTGGLAWQHGTSAGPCAGGGLNRDADFIAMQGDYRPSGGLANGDELASRIQVLGEGGYAQLARWIVGRQAFSFSWNEHFWLPMFQFDPIDLSLSKGVRPVLAELADLMDGWALATWFAQPNNALQGRSPVSMWSSHWPDVFQAARLQRFVLSG